MKSLLGGRVVVMQGDITEMQVDAVVNAANSTLLGGGGVDGAIHRKGGPEILSACRRIREERYPGGMPTGEAVITTAGRLPSAWVIHTVGPVWAGGGNGEKELLANAYRNSLRLASERSLKSVAFPAISTGVYRYPRDLAARTSLSAIRNYLASHELPETVYLVFFSEDDRQAFLDAIEGPGAGGPGKRGPVSKGD